jgi:nucleotide-binding universal stress UspA family protein
MRKLLVPLDGSAFAEQALPLALSLARLTRTGLHLVSVRPSLPLDASGSPQEEYLRRVQAQLEMELPDGVTHEVLVDELSALEQAPPAPNAVAEVLARAAARGVGLVIMTTHGRGGLRRAWLGSIADALVRIAPAPVLLMRPHDTTAAIAAEADRGIRHILIPLDGSGTAEQAIAFAQQIGEPFAARYTLVRVAAPLTWDLAIDAYGRAPGGHRMPVRRRAAGDYLDTVAAQLRQQDMAVHTRVLDGVSPAAAILDFASTHAVDLIVLSTSGAGGVRRLLLGSVADKLVRSGDVPVLICNLQRVDTTTAAATAAWETSTR